jgi:hypothetical protein
MSARFGYVFVVWIIVSSNVELCFIDLCARKWGRYASGGTYIQMQGYHVRLVYNFLLPPCHVNKMRASSWLMTTSSFSKEYLRRTSSNTMRPALVLGTCLIVFMKKSR